MREIKNIIALKKDDSLVEFDNRAEFERCNLKDFRRIWADGQAIIISLYYAESQVDELQTELAEYE